MGAVCALSKEAEVERFVAMQERGLLYRCEERRFAGSTRRSDALMQQRTSGCPRRLEGNVESLSDSHVRQAR